MFSGKCHALFTLLFVHALICFLVVLKFNLNPFAEKKKNLCFSITKLPFCITCELKILILKLPSGRKNLDQFSQVSLIYKKNYRFF